jgi:hypothetical protein
MLRPLLLLIALASPLTAKDIAKRTEWELTQIEFNHPNEHHQLTFRDGPISDSPIHDDTAYEGRMLPLWEKKTYEIPLFSLLLLGFVILSMRRLKARRKAML